MAEKKFVVVCDFDGTLTPKSVNSLFDVMDGMLTKEASARAVAMRDGYLPKALSGSLTPQEGRAWLRETIGLYIESGLTKSRIKDVLRKIHLREGAAEFLKFLKIRGVPIAIISYGVVEFIRTVLVFDGVSHLVDKIYATKLISDEDGLVTGYEPETYVLPDNKDEYSRAFADIHSVPYENILAIGDSGGDRKLGHLKENRLCLARDEKEGQKLELFAGTVAVSDTFFPAIEWLTSKIK